MIATKGLLTVDEQIEVLKLSRKRLPDLRWPCNKASEFKYDKLYFMEVL